MHTYMERRNFIITSLQPWDIEIGSTIKNTALEISRHNRVLYINTPLDLTAMRNRNAAVNSHRVAAMQGREPCVRQINGNMWVVDCPFMVFPVSKLPWRWLFDAVNRLNNRMIGDYITDVVKKFDIKNFIHIIDTTYIAAVILKKSLIRPCRFMIAGILW